MQRALEGLPGVHKVRVELETGEAQAEVDAGVEDRDLVQAARGRVIFSWARDVLARLRW